MGYIVSPIAKIDSLNFNPLTFDGKPAPKAAKIVICNRSTYMVSENGTVYTTASVNRKICLSCATSEYAKALYQLGVITKAEWKAHEAWAQAVSQYATIRSENSGFITRATRLGIQLTAVQKAALADRLYEAGVSMDRARAAAKALNPAKP